MAGAKKQTAKSSGTLTLPTTRQTRSSRSKLHSGENAIFDIPDSPEKSKPNIQKKRKSAASAAPQSSERGPGRPPKRQKAELSRTKSNQQVQGHGEDEAEAQTEAQEAEVEREEASTEDDVQQEGSMDRDEEGDAAETNAAVESSYDLFGQRRTWQRAMKAAADLRKTAKDYELKLKTTQGKTLRKHIARVAKLYDGLEDDSKEVIEAKNKSLQEPVNLLQSSLAILDINQSSHFRDTFRDMHTHVIPGLVELIDLIITARTAGWKEELYPSELEEVISFLGRLYSLCDHLSGFTDVKATEAPVVKPVKQTILPAIRAIHKHLVNERNRQKRAAQYSEQKMAEDRKRRHEGEESARAAHRKEIQKKRLATFQSLEKALLEDQAFQMPVQEAPPLKKARIEWTEEEDDELIMRLVEWSNEPNDVRYNNCLHNPVLQNKSADLIRKRALEYKKTLEDYYTERNGPIPQWVSSIE